MNNKRASNKAILIGGIILAALVVIFAVIYFNFLPKTSEGEKRIAVEVVFADNSRKTFDITTDQEYLRGALDKEGLVEGDESDYGLFIKTIGGVTADESKQQWWCITKGGEDVYTGVDMTPIEDGDRFEITLKTGW